MPDCFSIIQFRCLILICNPCLQVIRKFGNRNRQNVFDEQSLFDGSDPVKLDYGDTMVKEKALAIARTTR